MGFLDDIEKTVLGDGAAEKLIGDLIESHHPGGLQDIVDKLHQSGLGNVLSSWVNEGDHAQISNEALQKAIGSETVQKLAASTGIPVDRLLGQLAQKLPGVMSKAADEGKISPVPQAA